MLFFLESSECYGSSDRELLKLPMIHNDSAVTHHQSLVVFCFFGLNIIKKKIVFFIDFFSVFFFFIFYSKGIHLLSVLLFDYFHFPSELLSAARNVPGRGSSF